MLCCGPAAESADLPTPPYEPREGSQMASMTDSYKLAMSNFTALTTKVAPTLKNKGQEAGLKKLLMVMKSGKTLEQRAQDYDAAVDALKICKDEKLKSLPDLMKALNTATAKLNEGL